MTIAAKNYLYRPGRGWSKPPPLIDAATNLVLFFGEAKAIGEVVETIDLSTVFPNAKISGCSTSGEIFGTEVSDDTAVMTTFAFQSTMVSSVAEALDAHGDSAVLGRRLGARIPRENLCHVFVLCDGLQINGSALVAGITEMLPNGVAVTGGLAGDGARFQQTCVLADGKVTARTAVAVSFHSNKLRVGYGSLGGWDPFGPERVVTKAQGNVLYELDQKSALTLYKEYLGPHANDLPSSGLLFPLSIRNAENDEPLVRTILSVSEADQSITFAGDIPEGSIARFMKANVERLVDGAADASNAATVGLTSGSVQAAILISCVGRKLVLKQRVEEEVEAVQDHLGPHALLTGFYSYGEIAPFVQNSKCELHNQTMTITAFSEDDAVP